MVFFAAESETAAMPAFLSTIVVALLLLLGANNTAAQEKVAFPSTDEEVTFGAPTVIAGFLYKPEGPGPFPAVVGMHGCGGGWRKDGTGLSPLYAAWAKHLTAHGFVSLWVDGFTPRGIARVCGKVNPIVSPENVRPRDAYGGLLYLQRQSFVRPDSVFLMGWSHGGGTALYAVAADSHTRPKKLPHDDFRAAIAFYPGSCTIRSQGWSWKPAIPLLTLLGADDDWTPAEPCRNLMIHARGKGAPIETVVYPDAHHGFDSPGSRIVEVPDAKSVTGGQPHVGGHPEARAAAYRKSIEFMRATLN